MKRNIMIIIRLFRFIKPVLIPAAIVIFTETQGKVCFHVVVPCAFVFLVVRVFPHLILYPVLASAHLFLMSRYYLCYNIPAVSCLFLPSPCLLVPGSCFMFYHPIFSGA